MSLPAQSSKVVVTAFNPADPSSTLEVVQVPTPVPAAGEVLVKVTARPINPADVFSVMGVYPGFAPAALPATPGLEGCGIVVDSNGVEGLPVGTRGVIFPNTKDGNGSWQEYIAISPAAFLPIPDSVPDSSAAQFLVNPITVIGMLEELAVPAGEYLVQTAAGSVLGRQLITVAKQRGIKTINLIRRPEGAAELLALGADHVIVTTETENIPAAVHELTGGKGAYAAVDAVAGDSTAACTGSVRAGGTVIIYGAMAGIEFKGSVVDTLFRQVTIRGFWLNVWLGSIGDRKTEVFKQVLGMLADGSLVPLAGKSFPLADVVEAFKHSQSEARGGKVLLV